MATSGDDHRRQRRVGRAVNGNMETWQRCRQSKEPASLGWNGEFSEVASCQESVRPRQELFRGDCFWKQLTEWVIRVHTREG